MAINDQPLIVKKIKKGSHGHHGGAWKIAYADFVTAMMAFFLLMWLISMTTPEQKQGLADYFAPNNVSRSKSGAGGLMGGTAFDTEGARMAGSAPNLTQSAPKPARSESAEGRYKKNSRSRSKETGKNNKDSVIDGRKKETDSIAAITTENQNFKSAVQSLRQAMRDMPELAELSRNIMIEETPEGLNIQLVDQEGRSMFPAGYTEPYERTRLLLEQVAKIAQKLPNRVSISGHTDLALKGKNQKAYSKWELTADRSNATRRILQDAGLPDDRIYQVTGRGDSEPLFPEDPSLPSNRRISILLMREAPVAPADF